MNSHVFRTAFLMSLLMVGLGTRTLAQGGKASTGVTFESTILEMGFVRQHAQVQGLFRFTNQSADTIIFSDPRSGCGCTAALLSSPVVPPGGSGTLQVKFTASVGMLGRIIKDVTVVQRTRRASLPDLRLQVATTVLAEIESDTSHIRLTSYPGEKQDIVFTIRSNTDKPLSLRNVSVSLMEYADTTAGNLYHADKVIAKAFTDVSWSVDKMDLSPKESTQVRLHLMPRIKGQIHGSIRFALPESEVRIPITCVVYQTPSPHR